MKRIVALWLALVALAMAEPDWTTSYKTALAQAGESGKAVMVMLSREGCDACWYMENVVFEDDDVLTELMMDFVPVYIDIYNSNVPDGFSYIGTPTFYFMDAEGRKIERHDGAANVKEFTTLMRDVKKAMRTK